MKHVHAITSRHRARGFSLVAAIFVLVVLAALGAFLVTISSVQRQTAVGALQGARAYQAAQAGIEWATFRATQPTPACVASTFAPNAADLAGFSVTVNCAATGYVEGAANYSVYIIDSRATFGTFGDLDFYSRRLEVTVTNASSP